MKQYFWAIVLAVVVNTLIIVGIVQLHFTHKTKPAPLEVDLKTVVKTLKQKPTQVTTINWLKSHYGQTLNIDKTFKAGKNLTGFVVSLKTDPTDQSIIYSINHGQYYLMGTIIDRKGHNLSEKDVQDHLNNHLNKTIYEAAQKLSGIIQGKTAAPQATIIIDPNSNLFPGQWNDLNYDVSQGMFKIKWVLVNYLKPMGPNVANDILQAANPLQALAYNADHYDSSSQTGGYVKNLTLSKTTQQTLRNNWAFIQKYNLYKLPVTILQNGRHYYVIQGQVMDETLETIFADAPVKAT